MFVLKHPVPFTASRIQSNEWSHEFPRTPTAYEHRGQQARLYWSLWSCLRVRCLVRWQWLAEPIVFRSFPPPRCATVTPTAWKVKAAYGRITSVLIWTNSVVLHCSVVKGKHSLYYRALINSRSFWNAPGTQLFMQRNWRKMWVPANRNLQVTDIAANLFGRGMGSVRIRWSLL